ncbi:MAG: methyltransferase domain-containing protein, partial [Syntrophales bacterium]|nr:methyltransferase domain-containing protein [Syntrophales bacterium]
MKSRFSVGDSVILEITGVAFGGKGVGRIDGMVFFVPFTVDGDVVEVEIRSVRRNYITAELKNVLAPSPFRVDPVCKYHSLCGGCCYLHVSGERELALKEGHVVDSFQRIGKFPTPPVKPIIPSPEMYGYRQKAEFHRSSDRRGNCSVGFMSIDGKTLVDIEYCHIVKESINKEYRRVKKDRSILEQSPERMAFWSDVPYGTKGDIMRRVGDREIIVPASGFFQANALLVEKLARLVGEACRESQEGALLDCCCGSGLFSLFAARENQPVIGIDVDGESLRCARLNMARQGFSQFVFYKGTLEKVLKRLPNMNPVPIGTIILDPPR